MRYPQQADKIDQWIPEVLKSKRSDFCKNVTISLDMYRITASAENSQEEKDAAEFLNCTPVKFCLPTGVVKSPLCG